MLSALVLARTLLAEPPAAVERRVAAMGTTLDIAVVAHSREKALELGRALEDFYEMFFQTFAGFMTSPEQLNRLFNGTGPEAKAKAKPYVVHCYRSRQEYIDKLKQR